MTTEGPAPGCCPCWSDGESGLSESLLHVVKMTTVRGHRPWGHRPARADGHIHGAHLILPCPPMPSPAPRDPLCLGYRVLGLLVALRPYVCTSPRSCTGC